MNDRSPDVFPVPFVEADDIPSPKLPPAGRKEILKGIEEKDAYKILLDDYGEFLDKWQRSEHEDRESKLKTAGHTLAFTLAVRFGHLVDIYNPPEKFKETLDMLVKNCNRSHSERSRTSWNRLSIKKKKKWNPDKSCIDGQQVDEKPELIFCKEMFLYFFNDGHCDEPDGGDAQASGPPAPLHILLTATSAKEGIRMLQDGDEVDGQAKPDKQYVNFGTTYGDSQGMLLMDDSQRLINGSCTTRKNANFSLETDFSRDGSTGVVFSISSQVKPDCYLTWESEFVFKKPDGKSDKSANFDFRFHQTEGGRIEMQWLGKTNKFVSYTASNTDLIASDSPLDVSDDELTAFIIGVADDEEDIADEEDKCRSLKAYSSH
eukprot:m.2134 g.2134  ORF g.2134 m.2134 type:complete len:375 (+) comp8337_c0_seq1:156-1280(+)